jgi:hypothetical protein
VRVKKVIIVPSRSARATGRENALPSRAVLHEVQRGKCVGMFKKLKGREA